MFPSQGRPTRAQGLFCVAVLGLCVLLVQPVAEIGISDDWSYIRTAQLFAETGRIHYNGWATAMLVSQIFPAALLIKLFGFSFTAARMSTVLIASVTIYVFHRVCALAELSQANALLATLSLGLSPLFLPLATTFLSDMAGLATVVICLYCCFRAALGGRSAWVAAASCVSVLGGTSRQIAWLGALVMVPSVLLVSDRKPRLVGTVLAGWIASLGLILGILHWYKHQPHAVPETILLGAATSAPLHALDNYLGLTSELLLLALPSSAAIILAFYSHPRWKRIAATVLAVLLITAARHLLPGLYAPVLNHPGDVLGASGLFTFFPVFGERPALPPRVLGPVLTISKVCSAVAVGNLVYLTAKSRLAQVPQRTRVLIALTVPFTISYLVLLIPRAAFLWLFDRYALPLLAISILVSLTLSQGARLERRPWVSWSLLFLFAVYGIAVTHDGFALYRGVAEALTSFQGNGPGDLYGGWEDAGWKELKLRGYVRSDRLEPNPPREDSRPCPLLAPNLYPDLDPKYALSLDPSACGGLLRPSGAVMRFWLPHRESRLYIVHNAPAQVQDHE